MWSQDTWHWLNILCTQLQPPGSRQKDTLMHPTLHVVSCGEQSSSIEAFSSWYWWNTWTIMLPWCFKSTVPITTVKSECIGCIFMWWKMKPELENLSKCVSIQQNVSRSFPSKNQRGLFTISGEKALTGVGYLVDKNSQQECLNVRKLVEGCREVILYWKILPSLVWALGLCHTWRFVCHQDQSALPGTGNQTFLWEGNVKTLWNHCEDNTSPNTQLSGAVVW